jgi:predicted restriction endonuclease
MNKIVLKFREFIEGTRGFNGITMEGCYAIDIDTFLKFFDEYIKTGVNKLNDFHELNMLRWDIRQYGEDIMEGRIYESKETQRLLDMFREELSDEEIEIMLDMISTSKRQEEYQNTYEKKRLDASVFTSKQHVRKAVFDKHGKKCKHCGLEENLTLDHIIPICSGGENTVDNLQPLCKKCNSKKGKKANYIIGGVNYGSPN